MRTNAPIVLHEKNLSHAWANAFLHVMKSAVGDASPLIISLEGFENGVPTEDPAIRNAVDQTLKQNDKVPIDDNAFMIFPYRAWRRGKRNRQWLFERFPRMLPKIKARNHRNIYGTYFERMVSFVGVKGKDQTVHTVNQLDHVLTVWERDRVNGRRTRPSALQVSCFDPVKDHTGQPVRGFPCLQQVSFTWDNAGGLALSAYYPTQYIFDRGYGNYLGLCQLGQFMAHEMKLSLKRVNCYVTLPILGEISKTALADLNDLAEKI